MLLTGTLIVLAGLVVIAIIAAYAGLRRNSIPLAVYPGPAVRLRSYLFSSGASTSDRPRLPELTTPRYATTPATLYDRACLVCRQLGWSVVRQSSETLSVDAIASGPGFRADTVISIHVAADPAGACLRATARSRNGLADLGGDVRRIVDLTDRVDGLIDRAIARPAADAKPATITAAPVPQHAYRNG